MFQNVSINFRPDDHKSIELIQNIAEILTEKKIKTQLPDYEILRKHPLNEFISKEYDYLKTPDLVVAIGGDGTFLKTARMFLSNGSPSSV